MGCIQAPPIELGGPTSVGPHADFPTRPRTSAVFNDEPSHCVVVWTLLGRQDSQRYVDITARSVSMAGVRAQSCDKYQVLTFRNKFQCFTSYVTVNTLFTYKRTSSCCLGKECVCCEGINTLGVQNAESF